MDKDPPEDNETPSEWQTKTCGYASHTQNVEPFPSRRINSWDAVSRFSDRERTSNEPLPTTTSEVNFTSQPHGGQTNKLMRSRDQVRDLKLQLERAKQNIEKIEREKNEMDKNHKDLYDDYCHLKRNREIEHEQLHVMDQAESQWKRQCHDLEETIHSLQQALSHEKQHVASAKQLADRIHMEKDTSMVVFAPQMMDTNICQDLSSLLGDIRTWSAKFSCDTGRMPDFKLDSILRYQQVVPLCKNLADIVSFMDQYRKDKHLDEKSRKQFDKMRKRHFIRGWASLVMIEKCFWRSDSWLHKADSEAFNHIEKVLLEAGNEHRNDVPQREIHDWRALTAYLLSKATSQDTQDKSMDKIASKAASDVIGLLHPWARSIQAEELEQRLADIYKAAMELSCLLRKQRAHWELYFPTSNRSSDTLRYDSSSMEDINDKNTLDTSLDRRVEIVIEPALSKTGTMDGTKFEAGAHVTIKAKVYLAL
ncbi:hypothetical protein BS50DRAFT_578700 [Corynespora cassiicola Philippines]|uniref:Uncharacterized protein n=1 Tax=Corynespora cassiicola Philippines TaxID=1448308 RepID=A0A2T2N5Z9_CORCC|nr:hypothetical protein BS50DRAFT_578700 [Corynespora cassiicola Philippines]